jgi:hypothetical protein
MPPPTVAAIDAHQRHVPYHLRPPAGSYRCDPSAQALKAQATYRTAALWQRAAVACQYCRRRKVREILPTHPGMITH